ncbi:Filamentous haemagglutinin family outer membrane protein, probable fragment [Erwinia billingiae Eb661]|uniref:Filamentous haemagglutinin family outer membrane protein, probable n=2 Tax=Erwinia billingiae TaxID=182337 RepID=D8MSB3_ERWBE|nr:Filamentous haemagglutinin family outer membrane protein, probable fragment [Erwinia billingiae Eb661]
MDSFDAEKVQNSLTAQREMAALAQQVITQTFDYLKEQEKQEQKKKLENDSEFNKLTDVEKEKVLDKAAEDKYGIGSKMQIAAQAISGVFAGLAGGNVGGAVAAGAAPLLAQMVKQVSQDNEPLRILLHTLASGLIAKAQGGSVAGGAAGGLTAGLMGYNDALSKLLFGREPSELSADEKMLIANIITLAGAATGGAVDGSAGVGSGASAGRTEVENNYLSQKQQAQKEKEIAECQTTACKAGAQAKWTAIDLGQDGSFAAGMVAGVPAGLYDTIDSIVKTASNPQETYDALKSLFNSGDVLGNVSDAVKQSYIDRIDRMETEYQKAGASGSFNAGVEGGKLVTDIAGLLAGGAGVVKGGAILTEKVVAKTTGMVETALKSSVVNKLLEADRIGSGLKPESYS